MAVGSIITHILQKSHREEQRTVENNQRRDEQRVQAYNEILSINGQNRFILHIPRNKLEFEFELYNKEVRPVLYKNYHLFNSTIAANIRAIDRKVEECNYYEEWVEGAHELLCKLYQEIIDIIEKEIEHIENKFQVKSTLPKVGCSCFTRPLT